MSDERQTEPGFSTGLDLSNDDFSEEEARALLRWYSEEHSSGDVELNGFVHFLMEFRPKALKTHRNYAEVLYSTGDLPQLLIALMFLYYYVSIGNKRGIFYEVIAARNWGATKAEVLDVIEMAFLASGPYGLNATAELSTDYLREWPDDEPRAVAKPWPERWWTPSDLSEYPRSLSSAGGSLSRLLADHAEPIRAVLESRSDKSLASQTLPVQAVALIQFHHATAHCHPAHARAMALVAQDRKVTKLELLAVLGFALMCTTAASIAPVADALVDVLDNWT